MKMPPNSKYFKLLFSCLLIVFCSSSHALQNFKRSIPQFNSDYKKVSSTSLRFKLLDEEIKDYLSRKAYSDEDARTLFIIRRELCRDNLARCFNISTWNRFACMGESNTPARENQIRLWRSLLSFVTSTTHVKGVLDALSTCAARPDENQVTIAFDLAKRAEEVSIKGARDIIGNWIGAKFHQNPSAYLNAYSLSKSLLLGERPKRLQLIAALQVAPLISTTQTGFSLIAKNPSAKTLFSDYINEANFNAQMTGLAPVMINFNRQFSSSNSFLDLKSQLEITGTACLEWIRTGQEKLCEERLSALKGPTAGVEDLRHQLNQTMARYFHLTGNSSKAVAMEKETLLTTLDPVKRGWSEYALSNYYPPLGAFGDARNSLKKFKVAISSLDIGWLRAIIFSREQAISLMENNCKESLIAGEAGRSFLDKEVAGPTTESQWIDLMLLACYQKNGNKTKIAETGNRITANAKALPSLRATEQLVKSLEDGLSGKITNIELNLIKRELGQKNPDIVMIENFIIRNAKK